MNWEEPAWPAAARGRVHEARARRTQEAAFFFHFLLKLENRFPFRSEAAGASTPRWRCGWPPGGEGPSERARKLG